MTTDIAIFGLHPTSGELAVLLQQDGKNLALPSALLSDPLSLERIQNQAIDALGFDLPITPIVEQTATLLDQDTRQSIRIGYVAVSSLRETNNSTLLNPNRLAKVPNVTLTAKEIVANGLAWLHHPFTFNLSPRFGAKTHNSTLKILARLVLNPREFTISELRQASEAILGESLDPANFSRTAMGYLGIIPTDYETSGTEGRPARLYTMPPSILEG